MKGAQALALALVAVAALPATATAAKRTTYSIEKASGFQRLSYESDPSTCARYDVCGEEGVVTYRFGGDPGRGRLALTRRGGRQTGSAGFRSRGRTTSNVSGPSGACRDTVKRGREWFSLRGSLARLRFRFHPRGRGRDYLRTDCVAPSEATLAGDGALPKGEFDAADFQNQRTSFRLEGKSVFSDRGYRGELRWELGYSVKRR